MRIDTFHDLADVSTIPFEIVERKGRGHPDTLADKLAELLSRTYADICREQFGTVLRHQFDKLSLMGGKCDVRFGGGAFRSPIRLLINGRATPSVGGQKIHYRDALVDTAETFLERELRNFDFLYNCRVMFEVTAHTTRGVIIGQEPTSSSAYSRFRPGSVTDLPEYLRPLSNDTALGCGWAPYSPLERLVLEVEGTLNSDQTKSELPWLGSDIKTMAVRTGRQVRFTICVPQISTLVASAEVYLAHRREVEQMIQQVCSRYDEHFTVDLHLTTGDRAREDLIYMLYTGSCIESGDEGQVSRGNRIGGLISSRRPYTIEGLNGKNPQYHAGKIYSAAAWEIAERLWLECGQPSEVFVVSQIDRPVDDPWAIIVNTVSGLDQDRLSKICSDVLGNIGRITQGLLDARYPLV
ncbi:MAG: methionine adenosyltransferase [Allosphingosinicella sp.]